MKVQNNAAGPNFSALNISKDKYTREALEYIQRKYKVPNPYEILARIDMFSTSRKINPSLSGRVDNNKGYVVLTTSAGAENKPYIIQRKKDFEGWIEETYRNIFYNFDLHI